MSKRKKWTRRSRFYLQAKVHITLWILIVSLLCYFTEILILQNYCLTNIGSNVLRLATTLCTSYWSNKGNGYVSWIPNVYAYMRVTCVNARERSKDSYRLVKTQLLDPDRATDQTSCPSREFMISKAHPREIREIFYLLVYILFTFEYTVRTKMVFRSTIYGGYCVILLKIWSPAQLTQNIFKMHNHFTYIGCTFVWTNVSALRKLCKTSNGGDYW